MKYHFFIIFYVVVVRVAISQNLVMNPGFEEYWNWQQHPMQIPDTFFAKNWSHIYATHLSSADYYYEGNYKKHNEHHIFKYSNVPYNEFGYNPSHSGKAYAGIIPLTINLYMEHLTGSLTQPLRKGVNYEVTFFVKYPGQECAININKLEVAFSSDSTFFKIDTKNYNVLYKTGGFALYDSIFGKNKIEADLMFENIPLMNDTSDWMKLSTVYTAKGGETFFTIGFFKQNEVIENKLRKMQLRYQKIHDFKKRKKFIEKMGKFKIPFVEFNSNHDWSSKGLSPTGISEFGYYFIDDVSITPINK